MVRESAREIKRIYDMYFIYAHPSFSIHPFMHHLFPKRCRNEGMTIFVTIFFLCVLLKNRIFNMKHPIRIVVFHIFHKCLLHFLVWLLMLKMLSYKASIQSFKLRSWVFSKSRPSFIQLLVKKNCNLSSSFWCDDSSFTFILPCHVYLFYYKPLPRLPTISQYSKDHTIISKFNDTII